MPSAKFLTSGKLYGRHISNILYIKETHLLILKLLYTILSLKHKKVKQTNKHPEHADVSIRRGTHLSLLSVLLCSSPRFAKIFCLFCYRRLKWLRSLRDLASKVMNTKGKPMRKINPAGDTVHVSFVRTQALSVECRPFTLPLLRPYLHPTVGPAWADEFPSAVTIVIRTPLKRARAETTVPAWNKMGKKIIK